MSITRHDGKNRGSLKSIKAIALTGVTDTGLVVNEEITSAITITGDWSEVEFLPGEASWQEQVEDSPAGPIYRYVIQCQLNKDRKTVTAALRALAEKKLIVQAADMNDGQIRLLGEKNALNKSGADLRYGQIKELRTGRNSYDITITFASGNPAPYYSPV